MKERYDLLLTSDWHITDSIPENRRNNYKRILEEKIKFILDMSKKYKVPILNAGDIGEKSNWSYELLCKYITLFKQHPYCIYVLPGQHDLPNHNIKLIKKSAIGILNACGAIKLLTDEIDLHRNSIVNIIPVQFNEKIPETKFANFKTKICIIHKLVSQSKMWSGQEDYTNAKTLLRKYPYQLILSGDNHKSFIERYKGRILVNPGSLMRKNKDQINHKPRVYLWSAERNDILKIDIPTLPVKKAFCFSKIKKEEKEEKEMNIFVKLIDKNKNIKFKDIFLNNLKKFIGKHKDNLSSLALKKANNIIEQLEIK